MNYCFFHIVDPSGRKILKFPHCVLFGFICSRTHNFEDSSNNRTTFKKANRFLHSLGVLMSQKILLLKKCILPQEHSVIRCSERPIREKLVSAEYRIFGRTSAHNLTKICPNLVQTFALLTHILKFKEKCIISNYNSKY